MKQLVHRLLNKLPHVRGLYQQVQSYKQNAHYPPGHFYSPIYSIEEIRKRESEIWRDKGPDDIPGIDLHTSAQHELAKSLSAFYHEMPFLSGQQAGFRYYFDNAYYSYTDGIVLYAMMRHLTPKKIIEIGSGYSSALMLDVNEHFLKNKTELFFIDPYIERLNTLISDEDRKSSSVIAQPIQEVDTSMFRQLEKGDILFIDSTHVVKTGSDVNYLLFEMLPVLQSGVYIHFHDIFYPFEYPKEWVYQGWNWNEIYFLRAFLMYNKDFRIRLFSHYLHLHFPEVFAGMPLAYLNTGGNIWIEKV